MLGGSLQVKTHLKLEWHVQERLESDWDRVGEGPLESERAFEGIFWHHCSKEP